MNRVGIIGWPLGHSLSPAMHNAAFRSLSMSDWQYDLLPIPPDRLEGHLRTLRDEGGYLGVNVTVPHKVAVMPFIEPDETARAIGAVNTIDFRTNTGSNTDIGGLRTDLEAHGVALRGQRALVLGAGGAARAVVYALANGGARLAIYNRTAARADRLIADLGVDALRIEREQLYEWKPQLIVNCTSVGMENADDEMAAQACPWPAEIPMPSGATVYDVVYRPARTVLMRMADAGGGRGISGLGMLIRQGALAFQIWTGQTAPVAEMRAAAEAELYGKPA